MARTIAAAKVGTATLSAMDASSILDYRALISIVHDCDSIGFLSHMLRG